MMSTPCPEGTVEICLGFDASYVPHAAVTILSALQSLQGGQRLIVHALHSGGIDPADQQRLAALSSRVILRWYEIGASRYDSLPDNRSHVSSATYLRLFIPEVLGHVASRVIYLDCDTVVVEDLQTLWRTDLTGAAIAAAADEGGSTQAKRLGFADGFYFNAGILMFDLDAIDAGEFAAMVDQITNDPTVELELQDQDILNLMFAGQAHHLDLRWNANTRLFTENLLQPSYGPQEAERARAAPGILHFTDRRKPWHGRCNHPKRNLYWDLRNQTPWRENTAERVRRLLEDALRNLFSKSRRAARRGG